MPPTTAAPGAQKFSQTKLYDLLMGLPLIAWFVYGMNALRPVLVAFGRAALRDPGNAFYLLRFCAYLASGAFALLNVILIVVRRAPVQRARGLSPRAFAVAGTFLGVGIVHLNPAQLSSFWRTLALALLLVGTVGMLIAIAKLGKSFSIMPEARKLVTSGPYALARHPLYVMDLFSIAGTVILFEQPWAGVLGLSVVAMLVIRTHFEEQVLTEVYPEYADYKKRVKRFGLI
jgi:protein-S-isoprenylcysteine O-methyltransferase Ste14